MKKPTLSRVDRAILVLLGMMRADMEFAGLTTKLEDLVPRNARQARAAATTTLRAEDISTAEARITAFIRLKLGEWPTFSVWLYMNDAIMLRLYTRNYVQFTRHRKQRTIAWINHMIDNIEGGIKRDDLLGVAR